MWNYNGLIVCAFKDKAKILVKSYHQILKENL